MNCVDCKFFMLNQDREAMYKRMTAMLVSEPELTAVKRRFRKDKIVSRQPIGTIAKEQYDQ